MSTSTLSIRGLPEWLIRAYFEEMGATVDPTSAAGADGEPSGMDAGDWSVTWTSQRVALPGGLQADALPHVVHIGAEGRQTTDKQKVRDALANLKMDSILPGGTLSLTQFDIVFEADGHALGAVTEAFMKKAQRGGG